MTDNINGIAGETLFTGISDNMEPQGQEVTTQASQAREGYTLALANTDVSEPDEYLNKIERLAKQYGALGDKLSTLNDRKQMAFEDQKKRAQELIRLKNDPLVTPEMQEGANRAADYVLSEDLKALSKYSAESRAVDKLMSLGATDPVQARVFAENFKTPDVQALYRNKAMVSMAIQNVVSRFAEDKESQGIAADILDFAGIIFGEVAAIPGALAKTNVTDIVEDSLAKRLLSPGTSMQNQVSALYSMDPKKAVEYINSDLAKDVLSKNTFFGYTNSTSALVSASSFEGFSDYDAKFENVNQLVNIATVPGVLAAGKLVKSGTLGLTTMLAGRGNVREAVTRAMVTLQQEGGSAAAKTTGMQADEIMSAAVSSSADTLKVNPGFSVGTYVDSVLQKAEEFAKDLGNLVKPERLDPEELELAEQAAVDSVKKRLIVEPIDIHIRDTPLTTGGTISRVVAVFGEGAATAEEAVKYARALGFGDAQAVQKPGGRLTFVEEFGFKPIKNPKDTGTSTSALAVSQEGGLPLGALRDPSGRWFAKVEMDISETGFRTNNLKLPNYSLAGRWLGSGRGLSDAQLADIAELGLAGQREYSDTFRQFFEPFKSLGNTEKYHLQEVIRWGNLEGKWLADDEFLFTYKRSFKDGNGKSPEKALTAYRAYRDYNDFEWALLNDTKYENLSKEGYSTVNFANDKVTILDQNAVVKEDWKKISDTGDENYRIYDVSNGVHYHKDRKLTGDELAQYKGTDYVLVKTEFAQQMQDGTYVQSFLIKKSDLNQKPLNRVQVGYSEGGHRIYSDKWFVKQAVRKRQSDTGQQVFLAPNTFIAAPSKAAATKWAETMDAAREAIRAGGGKSEVDAIFAGAGRKGYPDADEFIEAVEKGDIPIDEKFEVVFDREMPSSYSNAGVDPRSFLDSSTNENSQAGLLRTQGRLFYSGKGKVLSDHMGETAAVVDPYRMMEMSMRNASRTVGMNEYRVQAIDRWFTSFKDKLDLRRTTNASAYEAFMHSSIDSSVPIAERAQIEAQRETIKRTLGFQSNYDRTMSDFSRQAMEWVQGDAEAGLRVNLGKTTQKVVNEGPLSNFVRGFVFDTKLGLFNPAQIFLQLSTAFTAAALRPQNSLQAALTYLPLRAILYRTKGRGISQVDDIVQEAVSKADLNRIGFSSSEEYSQFLKFAAANGRFKFTAEDTIVANFSSSSAYGTFGNSVENLRQAGRIFFNEGEMVNQLYAYHLAWKESRELFPNLAVDSQAFLTKVAGRTEDYSLRMLTGSKAKWQESGLSAIPFQFFAYPLRMLEASGALGQGRSAFTRAQQVRLVAAQVAYFGIPGVPFVQTITDAMSASSGETPELGTASGLFGRGLVDNTIYALTGADVTLGKRLAVGSFVDDLFSELFGYSPYGENSVVDFAGGAALSVFGNIGATALQILKWQTALLGSEENINAIDFDLHMNFLREISTVNSAMNGWYAYNYGKVMSRKGKYMFDVEPSQAAFMALGFRPGQENQLKANFGFAKNKKEHIDSAASVVHRLRQEWIDDPSKYEENFKKVQIFMAIQPKEWVPEISQKSFQRLDKSTLQGLDERVTRDIEMRKELNNG